MERKKYFTVFIIIVICLVNMQAVKGNNYASRIYEAYLTGDMQEWIDVMTEMEQSGSNDAGHLLELLSYYYGFTGYLISTGESGKAKGYIKKGEEAINRILKNEPENAQALSYKGTFIAFKLSMAPLKAMVLGPQTIKYINKAYTLEPEHYQIIADKANMLYYAPSLFGGNKKEAIRLYEESIRRMAAREDRANNWFYLSLQNSLAGMYLEQKKIEEARRIYMQLLQEEPRYRDIEVKLATLSEANCL